MAENLDLKKLRWRSRRGMLELDLLLVPFAQRRLAALSAADREQYRRLLQSEDQDLQRWLVGKEAAPEAGLRRIIAMILKEGGDAA